MIKATKSLQPSLKQKKGTSEKITDNYRNPGEEEKLHTELSRVRKASRHGGRVVLGATPPGPASSLPASVFAELSFY